MNKLQAKYERIDPISKTYKLVWQKDGGGPRFTDIYDEDTILFKDIRAKVENKIFMTSIVIILPKSYMNVLLQYMIHTPFFYKNNFIRTPEQSEQEQSEADIL